MPSSLSNSEAILFSDFAKLLNSTTLNSFNLDEKSPLEYLYDIFSTFLIGAVNLLDK